MNTSPFVQIYLDANATTPVLTSISDSVLQSMTINFGNPSSSHIAGLTAKNLLEQTRQLGKRLIGSKEGELLFTSGATEGIQTAIVSVLNQYLQEVHKGISKPVLLYGATEHKAVPNTLKHWNAILGLNADVLEIPVNNEGILDYQFIAQHIPQAVMICTMAVNNETGVTQDLQALEKVIREHNPEVAWLVDCVQALGKVPLHMDSISIDYAPFSGHKLYTPKGIGFLYIRSGRPYIPFIAGGGQESGMRSGTENLPGIAGLHTLFSLLNSQNEVFQPHDKLQLHRDMLVSALQDTFTNIRFHHTFELSVPTTLNFSIDYLTGKELIDLFDAAGIRVSGGSACSSGVTSSFVLEAMGLSDWQCSNAIRMSFGPADSTEFIVKACRAIRSMKSLLSTGTWVDGNDSNCSQWSGFTWLNYQSTGCWLFISKEKEAIVLNPIDPLLAKLKYCFDAIDTKRLAFLLTNENCQDENIERNIKRVFGKSARILKLESSKSEETLVSGKDWQITSTFEAERQSVIFKWNCEGDEKVIYVADLPDEQIRSRKFTEGEVFISQGKIYLSKQEIKRNQSCLKRNEGELVALMTRKEVASWIDTYDAQVLDIRETGEHQASTTELAKKLSQNERECIVNVPAGRVVNAYINGTLDPQKSYVIVCRSGRRSLQVAEMLSSLGFTRVANVTTGLALL
ncbi:aminotransferase class V-fold PLP-dependent enzyme [Pseudoalteromonas obscura]|uniref:cysteine desulfurase n=1 Tax=Pseudoalteromonas obscura TaxID=3048491 RepID=A0ABT7EJX8_9GAMM|nr:aminotransferase class V-fold PLP-dependent enzyme [Pseudoalteromonas sp. P94(2023)]MDK2595323.1 aminotransferase class V-fold PLP-dependent enzyme [Pseudoalteromonas sp. P94(2023)]